MDKSTPFKYKIDEVIQTVKQIAKFNTDFYKETIKTFLADCKISKANVSVLFDFLSDSDASYTFYEINNGKITLYQEKEQKNNRKEIGNISKELNSKFLLKLEYSGNLIKYILEENKEDQYDIDYNESLKEFEAIFASGRYYLQKPGSSDVRLFLSQKPFLKELFWENYIRSIVEAEYLSDKAYSKKLKKFIAELKNIFTRKDNPVSNSFYCVKSFIRISWLVIELCEKNKQFMTIGQEYRELIVVNRDRRLRFDGIFPNIFETGEKETRLWERLLESVVEMTDIDHRYIATNENIDKLLRLWRRLDFCERSIDHTLYEVIKIKTAGLLHEIIKSEKNDRVLVLNDEEEVEKKIDQEAENLAVCDFVKNRDNYSSYEELKKRECNTSISNTDDDILLYDNYTEKGNKKYYENKPLFPKENPNLDINTIQKFVKNNNPITSQTLIVDLFKDMYEKTKQILNNFRGNTDNFSYISDIKERLSILSTLEEQLQNFIDIHKTSKISSFRPPFEYSFYKIENDNNKLVSTNFLKDKNNETIFFASAKLSPIRIEGLEKKKQEFANKTQKLYHEYDQLLSETNAEKAKRQFENEIKDGQKNNISTLGIFAGLIAFITASVGFFKGDSNASIGYYAVFAFILVLGLGLLAVFLKLLFDSSKSNKKWINWLCLLVSVIGFVLMFIYVNYKVNNKEIFEKKQGIEQCGTIVHDKSNDTITIPTINK